MFYHFFPFSCVGVTVLVVKDPHDVAALHLLSVVGATADLLHTAMPVVLHLMLMGMPYFS